jgi:hypothetical protein
MRLIPSIAILLAILVLAPATAVLAHSPVFPEENHSPSTAYEISNPDKSWAIYTVLEHEGVDYYRFMRFSGEKIQISLIVPASPSDSGFLPSFALLGPGLIPDEHVNDHIKVPSGYGSIMVDGSDPEQAVYEPFTPGWFYEVGSLTVSAPEDGNYYIAVFDSIHDEDAHSYVQQDANYALIVGYLEAFTPLELVLIPYSVQEIYSWEGQNKFIIFLPMLLVLIVGGAIILYRRRRQGNNPNSISKWLAAVGGLLFLGSALGTIYQMSIALNASGLAGEALITLIIAAISIVLGGITWRYALRTKAALTVPRRVGLIISGVIALFLWSGFYLGPALVIVSALMPRSTAE